MKTTTLFKTSGAGVKAFWGFESLIDDWNGIDSEEYLVEIPEGFEVGENNCGEKMFFKIVESVGYMVATKGVWPYLVNAMFNDTNHIGDKIRVIKRIEHE